MRRLLLFLAVIGAGWLCVAAQTPPVWVTPDVPTDETLSGNSLMPWEIWRYDGTGYTLALSVPGNPDLNAIHKTDTPGDWLFSVEAPSDLGGALPLFAEPRDVVWYDASAGTYQLCLSGSASGIPSWTSVDAIHMDGGDTGDLIVSFDVPTDVIPVPGSFEPADLVRFGPIGPGICPGWVILAANPDFDASTAPGIAVSNNADGADGLPGTRRIFAFDVPTDAGLLAGSTAVVPGQVARWDTTASVWQLLVTLNGWPLSTVVDGLSCGGTTPGRVDPTTMTIGRVGPPSPDITLNWPGSCASGAQDYGIYEGNIGTWYSHNRILCTDAPPALTETITPGTQDHYYLVVPSNLCNAAEGSYGRCSTGKCLGGDERPVGTAVCTSPQVLPTPPACP